MPTVFQYKIMHVKIQQGGQGVEPSQIENELNIFGKDGWELFWMVENKMQQTNNVSGMQSYTSDVFIFLTLFFKKAIRSRVIRT